MTDCRQAQSWSLVAGLDQLELLELEDGAVLFDKRDGQTHHVNLVAATALQSLSDSSLDTDSLMRRIENRFGAKLDQEEHAQVLRMLTQMRALKLIQCKNDSKI